VKTLPTSSTSVTWDLTNDSATRLHPDFMFTLLILTVGNEDEGKLRLFTKRPPATTSLAGRHLGARGEVRQRLSGGKKTGQVA